jgi:hypothetical protein
MGASPAFAFDTAFASTFRFAIRGDFLIGSSRKEDVSILKVNGSIFDIEFAGISRHFEFYDAIFDTFKLQWYRFSSPIDLHLECAAAKTRRHRARQRRASISICRFDLSTKDKGQLDPVPSHFRYGVS